MGVIFDTLAFARRLEAVGFTREQAEALAEEQAKLIDERLATKHDLELLKRDLTIRTGTMLVALAGFLAIIRFFA